MAILNTVMLFAADIVEVAKPGGLWAWLILTVFSFIESYGLRVLVFTLIMKAVLSPLDIYQRVSGRKNQKITERLKPDLEKLKKQYPDKTEFSQKQMQLQRKEGYSYFSACLPAIVTMVIFITLLTSLNKISQYMNFSQYYDMYNEYNAVYDVELDSEYETLLATDYDAAYRAVVDDPVAFEEYKIDARNALQAEKQKDETVDTSEAAVTARALSMVESDIKGTLRARADVAAKDTAQDAVYDLYHGKKDADGNVIAGEEGIKQGFLWVKNIWSPDVPWKTPINNQTTWKTNSGKWLVLGSCNKDSLGTGNRSGVPGETVSVMESMYPTVIAKLEADGENNKTNGLLIMPLLALAFSILQQLLTQKLQKKSGQDMSAMGGLGGGNTMKMMMWIMPIMIGVFALQYTAAFSIYLVISYGFSLVITLAANLLFYFLDRRERVKQETTVQRYGRPDPKDL